MRLIGTVDKKLQPGVVLKLSGLPDKDVRFTVDTGFSLVDDKEFALKLMIDESVLVNVRVENLSNAYVGLADGLLHATETCVVYVLWDGTPLGFPAAKGRPGSHNLLSVVPLEFHRVIVDVKADGLVVIDQS